MSNTHNTLSGESASYRGCGVFVKLVALIGSYANLTSVLPDTHTQETSVDHYV